jgi:hypothetical protein
MFVTMNENDYVPPADYLRLLTNASSLVLGLVITILSRSVWIEVAWIEYRGTDDWYGWVVMASGFVIAASGTVRIFDHFKFWREPWTAVVAALSSLIPIAVASAVGLRTQQISSEIQKTARSPERWFEGTILEGLGNLLADVADSLSDPFEPRMTDEWRWLLALGLVSLILNLFQMPWSQLRRGNNNELET